VSMHLLPRCILITGATGAIGSALAEAYARSGVTLILHGRDQQLLDSLAERCSNQSARVLTWQCDLRDCARILAELSDICQRETVDLVIVNAGVNTSIGLRGEVESWESVEEVIDVNVRAAMATLHAVLPSMRLRGSGQIALMSSLAAWYGLPLTPSYSASKAALKNYGEALRGWLGPEGIQVSVIMPGCVESAMCSANPGPKPFLWRADKAARFIVKGLAAGRARIMFPLPLTLGCWLLSLLPSALSCLVLKKLGYRG